MPFFARLRMRRRKEVGAAEIKIVVGLGNPGDEYAGTRHNIGFRVIDSLAEALHTDVKKKKFGARFGQGGPAPDAVQGGVADKKLILLKPWQFMNCSGQPVATAVGFYKLRLSGLLVVTDDMAIEPGRIRIRARGSAGGHNGLADIIEKLGTNEFGRLRVGIGQSDRADAEDFVLAEPTRAEKPLLDEAIEKAKEAVLCWVEYGIEEAMNRFNN